MNTESDFAAALDADPGNGTLRQIYADYLDEQEPPDPRGPGYRALGRLGRVPEHGAGSPCPWFQSSSISSIHDPRMLYVIPAMWFDLIKLRGKAHLLAPSHAIRTDCPRRELEDAAALAWSRLSPAQQAAILPPVESATAT